MPAEVTHSNPPAVRAPTGYTPRHGGHRRRSPPDDLRPGRHGAGWLRAQHRRGPDRPGVRQPARRAGCERHGRSENIVKTTVFLTDRGLLAAYRAGARRGVRRPCAGLHVAVRRRAGRSALGRGDRSRSGSLSMDMHPSQHRRRRVASRRAGLSRCGRRWCLATRDWSFRALDRGGRRRRRVILPIAGPAAGRSHRRLWPQLGRLFHRLAGVRARRLRARAGELRADRRGTVLHRAPVRRSAGAGRRGSAGQSGRASASRIAPAGRPGGRGAGRPRSGRRPIRRWTTTSWRRSSIHPARRRRPRVR